MFLKRMGFPIFKRHRTGKTGAVALVAALRPELRDRLEAVHP